MSKSNLPPMGSLARRTALLSIIGLMLGACGGGGGSSQAPAPTTPATTIAVGDVDIVEGDSGSQTAIVNVTLSAAAGASVTVDFQTNSGTATAGQDFTDTSGTLTIPAGATSGNISIPVVGDTTVEPDESFSLTLSNPTNATLADSQAAITITNDDAVASVGLNARPDNTTCLAPARTTTGGSLSVVDAFPSLPDLSQPMKIIQPVNDSSLFFAVLRQGGLQRFSSASNVSSSERYLDITVSANGEGGFLSAALHPDWPATKEIYVSYTLSNPNFTSRLSRLVINDDSTLPASFTEEVLLTIDQPASNHNGGDIAFGADDLLYYAMGDGGGSGDSANNGQTTSTLLGNILRLQVLGVAYPSPGYNIPGDNPFAGNSRCGPSTNAAACPEIFAYGFRNPWRMSFDQANGDLWVGDVGQGAREEVDIVTLGGNYGWRCREGFIAFNTNGCAATGFTDPVFDYDRSAGDRSITGGFVYRGSAVPGLVGKYIFGDFVSNRIWSLENQAGTYVREDLIDNGFSVSGFSQDNAGEVYVLGIGSGRILRFTATGGVVSDNVPDDLAATGCFDAGSTTASSNTIPYQPAAAFWSDGATKQRWLALPNSETVSPANASAWNFPNGTVLTKNFSLNNQLIETRLFMRHPDGEWAGYTYQWNDAQTVATRVRNGATRAVGGQNWIYPSESECLTCHTSVSGFVLGVETAQLNNNFNYPSTGITDNQLEVFNHIGVFTQDVPEPVSALPSLADPADASASLESRARAYLHTNCAQCHQPTGPTGVDIDLRFDTALANTESCDVAPSAGDLGIANARLVAPGDAARSILVERMDRLDADAMPPLASNLVDTDGVALVRDWINAISACP